MRVCLPPHLCSGEARTERAAAYKDDRSKPQHKGGAGKKEGTSVCVKWERFTATVSIKRWIEERMFLLKDVICKLLLKEKVFYFMVVSCLSYYIYVMACGRVTVISLLNMFYYVDNNFFRMQGYESLCVF